ncbi:DUF692 domain-containing protein [Vibrio tritonius]|uniref:DUF692 domain-containing protein n=1 Tax=Vibrio tritonius TaxID=1435069 RepID=A0ABS7YQ42_9VIBR|nr:DUF692 domain-containing protein [Vibrio tritonius]MCA2017789.1 DUF692 domain-containing protein [Vibrio tritonius]
MTTQNLSKHRCKFPKYSGVSFKPQYFDTLIELKPPLGFVEIHAENYLSAGGPLRHYLQRIREDYPITVHGVGLSIGGTEPLNKEHLDRVASLVEHIEPVVFSEHLAWSSHGNAFLNDLLPIPYTKAHLERTCRHIHQIQERLGDTLLMENPSTYITFAQQDYTETEFIREMVRRTGCELLLDVNNIAVSCFNHQQDPEAYLADFPLQFVSQIHLAGYHLDTQEALTLRIDSHGSPVQTDVWQLYQKTLSLTGDIGTLIEWDSQLPPFKELLSQACLADKYRQVHQKEQQHALSF